MIRIATSVLLSLPLLACGVLPKKKERGDAAVTSDAGGTPGRWRLDPVADRAFEPGEWIELRAHDVPADASRVYLWVYGLEPADAGTGETVLPWTVVRDLVDAPRVEPDAGPAPAPDPEDGGVPSLDASAEAPLPDAGGDSDAATTTDAGGDAGALRSLRLATPCPILAPGRYRIGAGTEDTLETELVTIDVTVPTPRLSQAATASLLASGLGAIGHDLRTALNDPDPAWQAWLRDQGVDDDLAQVDALVAALDDVAGGVRDDYMMVDPTLEPAVQSVLDESGLLPMLEARLARATFDPRDLHRLPFSFETLIGRPIHGLLFALDMLSATLSVLGQVIDAVEIIAAITGAVPVVAVGVGAKVAVALAKFFIDSVVPTDLQAIYVQDSRVVFQGEAQEILHWGHFRPQNDTAGGVRSLEDLVLLAISEILPTGARRFAKSAQIREALSSGIRYVGERIPGAVFQLAAGETFKLPGVVAPLDMEIYSILLGDILALIPFVGPTASVAARLFFDPDLASSVYVYTAAPEEWAGSANLSVDYDRAAYAVRGVAFPGGGGASNPVETAHVLLRSAGWTFGSLDAIVQLVKPDFVYRTHRLTRVRSRPDPARGEVLSDEAYIVQNIAPGDDEIDAITTSLATTRTARMTIRDTSHGFDPMAEIAVSITVNDVVQHPEVRIVDLGPPAEVTLQLEPGENIVTIDVAIPEGAGCGDPIRYAVCTEFTLSEVLNVDPSRAVRLRDGESFTFVIHTPPSFAQATEE